MRNAVRAFLLVTAAWFGVFVVDFAVSWLGVTPAPFLDNLGLPSYFLAMNVGGFAFVVRFLGSGPLVAGGKVTAECRAQYGLTAREVELAERLLGGGTNQEIADALFISRKTVENHLYSMYQKVGVKNRVQFLRTLLDYGRP
jgi:DNA-binding CsgD family transcriptional regulator